LSQQVYNNRHFKIYITAEGEYIVHNSHKSFESGHTHVRNFSTAKYLTKLAVHSIVPKHLSKYLLVSLIRISTDSEYKGKLYAMLRGQ